MTAWSAPTSTLLAGVLVVAGVGAPAPGRAQVDPHPPLEERLLLDATQDEVSITATFSGSELFVFGAIARNRFLQIDDEPPDVAIVVRGPSAPVMVRKKDRVAGLWMNREAIRIAAAPSFYAVASTRPLYEILSDSEDRAHSISLDKAVLILGIPRSAQDPELFRQALIRLRREKGVYLEDPTGVKLNARTLYQARLQLPANIVEGAYDIRVYLLRDRRVRDSARIALPVRLEGLERTLYVAAQETPFWYGVGTLLTALFFGWGASELFRRLRGR